VKVPMNANRMQKPMAKLARKEEFFKCTIQALKCEPIAGVTQVMHGVFSMVKYTSTAPNKLRTAKK
jgi:hypothetical protein